RHGPSGSVPLPRGGRRLLHLDPQLHPRHSGNAWVRRPHPVPDHRRPRPDDRHLLRWRPGRPGPTSAGRLGVPTCGDLAHRA
ncbi:hypothetical protein IWQ60_012583, partial [Tieghemiomyces parasiticus]